MCQSQQRNDKNVVPTPQLGCSAAGNSGYTDYLPLIDSLFGSFGPLQSTAARIGIPQYSVHSIYSISLLTTLAFHSLRMHAVVCKYVYRSRDSFRHTPDYICGSDLRNTLLSGWCWRPTRTNNPTPNSFY